MFNDFIGDGRDFTSDSAKSVKNREWVRFDMTWIQSGSPKTPQVTSFE